MRHSNRRVTTLQISVPALNINATAAATNAVETLFAVEALFGNAGVFGAAVGVKEVILHGIDCYSDAVVTAGPGNGIAVLFTEAWYVCETNTAGVSTHNGSWATLTNEWSSAVDRRVVPDRIMYRRQGIVNGALGDQVSESNNWNPVHSRMKRKLLQSEMLVLHWELSNPNGGVTASVNASMLAVVRYEVRS